MIAVCSPELNGDVLWAVPAARALAARHNCQADFWVANRARRLSDLLGVQRFVRQVIVDETYVDPPLGHSHPIEAAYGKGYAEVYQLGFHTHLELNGTLLDHFCQLVNVPRQGHWFDIPDDHAQRLKLPEKPYVTIAFKGHDQSHLATWGQMIRDFARRCPRPVVEVGIPGHAITANCGGIDRCSWGFLDMMCVIANCKWFIGSISAPLVLADAWPDVVRIAVHDGHTWNLERCTQSPMNHYPVCYDADTLLRYIG